MLVATTLLLFVVVCASSNSYAPELLPETLAHFLAVANRRTARTAVIENTASEPLIQDQVQAAHHFGG